MSVKPVSKSRQLSNQKLELQILIHSYLMDEGLTQVAQNLRENLHYDVDNFQVCDNVDLNLILTDFVAFFQMRFHKKPNLIKTRSPDELKETKQRQNSRTKNVKNNSGNHVENQNQNFDPNDNPIGMKIYSSSSNSRFSNDGQENAFRTPIMIPKSLATCDEYKTLALLIAREFIDTENVKNAEWNDVVGLDQVKEALNDHFILPLRYPDVYKSCGISTVKQAILLKGPPGTGKTMLARTLASQEPQLRLLNLSASSLSSKWRGESEKLMKVAFELARENLPCLIFMDEVDAILGDRGGVGEHEASRRCKSEFLVQMDGIMKDEEPIFLMAATNLEKSLDSSVLRRFNRVLEVGMPTPENRKMIFLKNLENSNINLTERDLDILIKGSENLSGADIKTACENTKRKFAGKIIHAKQLGKKFPKLEVNDILSALEAIK